MRTLIDQIVKRDRLPSNNSLQAQHALRNAWNTIDVCVYNAGNYKLLAKAAYILCLLLGLAIIVLSVFKAQISGDNGTRELLVQQLSCFVRNAKAANLAANGGNCSVVETTVGNPENVFSVSTGIFVTASLLTMVRRSSTTTITNGKTSYA